MEPDHPSQGAAGLLRLPSLGGRGEPLCRSLMVLNPGSRSMALVRNKTEREPRVLAVVVRPARNPFRAAVCARRVES